MKDQDPKSHKKRRFIKTPTYPGGKKAFTEFVMQNLRYPEEALEKQIEGVVYIEYYVDNVGYIGDVAVKHGIGYGCDEEAIRLIRMLVYEPVRNRGIKMKVLMKARIAFKLPPGRKPEQEITNSNGLNISYTIVNTPEKENVEKPSSIQESGYTIILSNS